MSSAWMVRSVRSVVGKREIADCDGGGITPCFFGGRVEVGELGVAEVVRVDVERGGIVGVEPFEERLRCERPSSGCAGFDTGGFVDLLTEGGDFGQHCCVEPNEPACETNADSLLQMVRASSVNASTTRR